ncbi:MAG TPA: RNA polymerase sigma factor [Ilumatobacter sp.]|nr:RNA polymerase sigma factor [Ilumatobacter sp.]
MWAHGIDDLTARFRDGDEAAVRLVYERYGGAIGAVARSILGDSELVAEAVQDTMLKAWRAAATVRDDADQRDPERGMGPWLYSIARHAAIDIARREHRPAHRDHAPEVDVPVMPVGLERTWEAFEVRRAVDELPAELRDVIRMSHHEGLPHEQIAERLGIPVGTVKSRSHRAHRQLAAALAHMAPANQSESQTVVMSEHNTEHQQ